MIKKTSLERLASLATKKKVVEEVVVDSYEQKREEELRLLKRQTTKGSVTPKKGFNYDSTKPVDPTISFNSSAQRRLTHFVDPRFKPTLDKDEQRRFTQNFAFLDELRAKEFAVGKKVLKVKGKRLGQNERKKLERHIQHIASENNLRKRITSRKEKPKHKDA